MSFESDQPGAETPWRRLHSRTVYEGRVRVSEHAVVLPDGTETTFEVDESIPFAVAVLLSPVPGSVILARQYRYAIDSWIYDLPGGAGNPGEDPEVAARRECGEETGSMPDQLVHLHTIYPNPGRAAWPLHLYFATTSVPTTADTSDPAERVEPVLVRLEALDDDIRSGRIVDPALLAARLFAGLKGLLPALAPSATA